MPQINELKTDPEFRDLFPPLSPEEYKTLESSIKSAGKIFAPIFVWNDYIVDGHNRVEICKKLKIHIHSSAIVPLAYSTKDEVIQWMLDFQLGRRNLTSAQRICIAEKYRPMYEEKARENQSAGGGDQKSGCQISDKAINNVVDVKKELAKIAGVSHDTYAKGVKILNSDNEEVKKQVMSGEKKINTAYNELFGKKKVQPKDKNDDDNNDAAKHEDVKSQPQVATRKCAKCGQVKPLSEYNKLIAMCDECAKDPYKQVERDYAAEVKDDGSELAKIIKDLKTPKKAIDYIVVSEEIDDIRDMLIEALENADQRIFDRYDLYKKFSDEDLEHLIGNVNQVSGTLMKLQNKIKEIKIGE